MNPFELQLTVKRDEVSAETAGGGEGVAKVDRDKLRRLTVRVLAGWVAGTRVNDRNELMILGGHLYRTIFNGDVETRFLEVRTKTKAEGRRLRLQLRFEGDAELVDLPWEYLWYPGNESGSRPFFLATETDISIMRWTHAEEANGQNSIVGPQPLRVLLSHSVPDAPAEHSQKLVQAMVEKAGKHPPDVKTISPYWPEFLEFPGEPLPHVLHLVAQAGQNEGGRRGLALMTAEGENLPIDDEQLVAVLEENHWLPRLVVLQIWEEPAGIGIRSGRALSSVARTLMEHGVEAVVAVEYPPNSPRGLTFSTWLYKELSEGASIDSAVQKGRFWVWNLSNVRNERWFFGVPVLYMNHDVQLVEAPAKNGSPEPEGQKTRQDPAIRATGSASASRPRPDSQSVLEAISAGPSEPQASVPTTEPDQGVSDIGAPQTNPIEAPRVATDPLMVPLVKAATQAANSLGIDARDGARVVDAIQGLTAAERIDWSLARLREPDQYAHENELLAAIAEVAITQAAGGEVVLPGSVATDPLAHIIRYTSATIAELGLPEDDAVQLSRVLIDVTKELMRLKAGERVDWLFARLREPAQYEHELEVLAAVTEVAVVEDLEATEKKVRSSSGGTDPALAPVIRCGIQTIIDLDLAELETIRATQALSDLTRKITGMSMEERANHLTELMLARQPEDPVRQIIATLVFQLEGA